MSDLDFAQSVMVNNYEGQTDPNKKPALLLIQIQTTTEILAPQSKVLKLHTKFIKRGIIVIASGNKRATSGPAKVRSSVILRAEKQRNKS